MSSIIDDEVVGQAAQASAELEVGDVALEQLAPPQGHLSAGVAGEYAPNDQNALRVAACRV